MTATETTQTVERLGVEGVMSAATTGEPSKPPWSYVVSRRSDRSGVSDVSAVVVTGCVVGDSGCGGET
jgi:hypothetical protein